MDASTIEAIVEAVKTKPAPFLNEEGFKPFMIVPQGFEIKSLDQFRAKVDRVVQGVTVLTAADFLSYWMRFSSENSVVVADARTANYVGLNVDNPRDPRHKEWKL